MDRRGRTNLDHCDDRAPLLVIEFRGMPGRLAVDETIRPPEIEPEDPIANGLQPHAPEPSRVRARAAVIDRDERQQAPVTLPAFSAKTRARSIGPSKSPRNEIGAAISNSPRLL